MPAYCADSTERWAKKCVWEQVHLSVDGALGVQLMVRRQILAG